jgi:hypothetical protein
MAASVQASAKRVCFLWQFLFSVSAGTIAGRGKLLPANFLAAV